MLKGKLKKALAIGAACVLAAGCLALAACGGSSSSQADYKLIEDGKLTIGTSPDYPPFENLEDGEAVGFDIDLAKAVAEQLGLELEIKSLQFDSILPAVQAGGQCDVGISGITVDPERAKEVDFTDSYYTDDQAVAVMKDSTEITADNAEDALNKEGVTIAVQSGTTGETYCKENFPKAKVQPYGNSTDAFAAMQAGQANAVCTNNAVVEKMLADAYSDAQVVYQSATGEEYAIAVSQDNPQLTAAINDAIKTLKDNGKLDELTAQWLG